MSNVTRWAPGAFAKEDCRAHLRDLRRAYCHFPKNVDLPKVSVPGRLAAPERSSGCGSPAAAMADDVATVPPNP